MIECTSFRSFQNKTLLGFANFFIPEWNLEMYDCSLHMKDGKRWISFPSKEYTSKSGEKKWSNYFRFKDVAVYEAFCEKAKEAIDKWCAANNVSANTQSNSTQNPFAAQDQCAATAHSPFGQPAAQTQPQFGQPAAQEFNFNQGGMIQDECPF